MIDSRETPEGILDLISQIRATSSEILRQELEKNGIEGIVPAHGTILFYLFNKEKPVHLGEVVKASGRAKSTITGMITTLEKHGYLKRIHCEKDKRSILVEMTPKGESLKHLFNEISDNIIYQVYDGIEREDQEHLIKTLRRINKNLKKNIRIKHCKGEKQ